jgi:hypothetical protein
VGRAARSRRSRRTTSAANVGGPLKIPGLWSNSGEELLLRGRRVVPPGPAARHRPHALDSLAQAAAGDFSDWRDCEREPDPDLRSRHDAGAADGTVGPDRSRATSFPPTGSPARPQWLAVPAESRRATDRSTTTWCRQRSRSRSSATPTTSSGASTRYIGQKDHLPISLWHQRTGSKFCLLLPARARERDLLGPAELVGERLNWDHTFSSNSSTPCHVRYLNRNEGYGSVNQDAVDQLPDRGRRPLQRPSQISFSDDFARGATAGVNIGNVTTRPTYVRQRSRDLDPGRHTIKGGFEYRNIGGNVHCEPTRRARSLRARADRHPGPDQRQPDRELPAGAVDSGTVAFRTAPNNYPRQKACIVHVGDTWQFNSKLSAELRPALGLLLALAREVRPARLLRSRTASTPTPAAARPLAYAGSSWGAASYGARYPEKDWYGGLRPRLGFTTRSTKDAVRRAGASSTTSAFYPGWGAGISQDGFNTRRAFNSSLGGLAAGLLPRTGLPAELHAPPFIGFRLPQRPGLTYRPLDANERARSQQWNLRSTARSPGFTVGRRLRRQPRRAHASPNVPINALDPSAALAGPSALRRVPAGQTSLQRRADAVPGLASSRCRAARRRSAQALLPYPAVLLERCRACNENHGTSDYNSLQARSRSASRTARSSSCRTRSRSTRSGPQHPVGRR